jgi:hypothetical protein
MHPRSPCHGFGGSILLKFACSAIGPDAWNAAPAGSQHGTVQPWLVVRTTE